MAMEVWPQLLPQVFAAQGISNTLADNIIDDDYKIGPPYTRRRTTSGPEKFSGQMFMTAIEWQALSAFFHTTLFDGVMRFLLPPQGATEQTRYWVCRFISPPSRQMMYAADLWAVSLFLERLGYGQAIASPALFSDDDNIYAPTVTLG